MPRQLPPPVSVVLTMLRAAKGWTQNELAAAASTPRNLISDYEKGRRTLTHEKLTDLAKLLGYDPGTVDVALAFLDLSGVTGAACEEPATPVDPLPAERKRARRAAARLALAVADATKSHLLGVATSRHAGRARRKAGRLWQVLEPLTPATRRRRIDDSVEFHNWALCELLCNESLKAAAHSAEQALELAHLALRAAELSPGGAGWRSPLQGFAWAFIANARRVAGDLPSAESAFACAWQHWQGGLVAGRTVLGEWRLLHLQASLRMNQRNWTAALDLLSRARAAAPPEATSRILLTRASTLNLAGETSAALATLREAAPLLEPTAEPRLRYAWSFQVVLSLCGLGQYDRAEAELPALRKLSLELGNDLDLVRSLWMTARVAAGRGRTAEACKMLNQVRQDFAARRNAYDTALASLELAVLYLETERRAEARELARQMVWIFKSQAVHREALAALKIFCESARDETATAEQARKILAFIAHSHQAPQIRHDSLV
jgi:transcriptional regulator with XRE-family HTH domain/ribosomal protein L20